MPTLKRLCGLLLLVIISACSTDTQEQGADLILTNARVYTLAWNEPAPDGTTARGAPYDDRGWRPDADAVVVTGGSISYVGSSAEAARFQGRAWMQVAAARRATTQVSAGTRRALPHTTQRARTGR